MDHSDHRACLYSFCPRQTSVCPQSSAAAQHRLDIWLKLFHTTFTNAFVDCVEWQCFFFKIITKLLWLFYLCQIAARELKGELQWICLSFLAFVSLWVVVISFLNITFFPPTRAFWFSFCFSHYLKFLNHHNHYPTSVCAFQPFLLRSILFLHFSFSVDSLRSIRIFQLSCPFCGTVAQ